MVINPSNLAIVAYAYRAKPVFAITSSTTGRKPTLGVASRCPIRALYYGPSEHGPLRLWRRAEVVKRALLEEYKVDGTRLNTDGHGASQPKDTNESVEGRARNRRVELVKVE